MKEKAKQKCQLLFLIIRRTKITNIKLRLYNTDDTEKRVRKLAKRQWFHKIKKNSKSEITNCRLLIYKIKTRFSNVRTTEYVSLRQDLHF